VASFPRNSRLVQRIIAAPALAIVSPDEIRHAMCQQWQLVCNLVETTAEFTPTNQTHPHFLKSPSRAKPGGNNYQDTPGSRAIAALLRFSSLADGCQRAVKTSQGWADENRPL
jgi:hypothetical protein